MYKTLEEQLEKMRVQIEEIRKKDKQIEELRKESFELMSECIEKKNENIRLKKLTDLLVLELLLKIAIDFRNYQLIWFLKALLKEKIEKLIEVKHLDKH